MNLQKSGIYAFVATTNGKVGLFCIQQKESSRKNRSQRQTERTVTMIETKTKDKITIIIPGRCHVCGCEVTPENVGFECDEFVVCEKCEMKPPKKKP